MSSSDFETLINVSKFMQDLSSEEGCFDYSGAGVIRAYHKLCKKLGKDVVQSFVNSREKEVLDLRSIDHFIDENYFELIGVAKDPLTGFDGKFSKEMIGEISSFLSMDDVQL